MPSTKTGLMLQSFDISLQLAGISSSRSLQTLEFSSIEDK